MKSRPRVRVSRAGRVKRWIHHDCIKRGVRVEGRGVGPVKAGARIGHVAPGTFKSGMFSLDKMALGNLWTLQNL